MRSLVVDVETMGLNPFEHRLTVISACYDGEVTSFTGEEKDMLTDFWEYTFEINPHRLVGYNLPFDVSFIEVRSLLHNVKGTKFNKWKGYIDLMRLLLPWGSKVKFAKLQLFCDLLGFEGIKSDLQGKDMPGLFEDGKLDTIVEHCEDDVLQTWRLMKRCEDCGFL